jgi:hypothetical protein
MTADAVRDILPIMEMRAAVGFWHLTQSLNVLVGKVEVEPFGISESVEKLAVRYRERLGAL